MTPRHFSWYPQRLAVVKLPPTGPLPFLEGQALFSLTRTPTELSLVVAEDAVPATASSVQSGWRALAVQGPLDFALVGILAELSTALAAAGVSLFAVSTFDTDLILVAAHDQARAEAALRAVGWHLVEPPTGLPVHEGGG
jgi:hypothetical protein